MSEFILRKTAGTQVALYSVSNMLAGIARQAAERFQREQTGQDLVEYGGVLAIIALVVGALFATGFWSTVASDVTSTVNSILSGHGTSAPKGH